MPQALLCGLNGFIIFLEENEIAEIVSWQDKRTGCYKYVDNDDSAKDQRSEYRRRRKRSASQLSDMCSDHMTGLAVATLGLIANFAV